MSATMGIAADTGLKTRDKILHKSLELFNQQGERKVSTNHIAAALGMSPGNLYYHFRNKDAIILELFREYEAATQRVLQTPSDRALNYVDKLGYFEGLLRNMWAYRFLHRDLEHLMADNPELKSSYRHFALNTLAQGQAIYEGLAAAGLIEAEAESVNALIINIWVLLTSWIPFLETAGLFGEASSDALSHDLLKRGIYQILLMEAPYLRGEALLKLPELKALYRVL